jgi:hypothetical protein
MYVLSIESPLCGGRGTNHHPAPLEGSRGFSALSRAIVDEEMIVPIPAGKIANHSGIALWPVGVLWFQMA